MDNAQGWLNEAEVVQRAYRALRPLLVPESAFRRSVTSITTRCEHYARARLVIERRIMVRRSTPADDVTGELEAPITPQLDPWLVALEDVPRATRQLTRCLACNGQGGEGCEECSGSGRVHTWLEVSRRQHVIVRADPPVLARHFHPSLLDERDFARGPWLHRLLRERTLGPEQLGELPRALAPELGPDARIVAAHLQHFTVAVHDLHYQTALGTGSVEVAGRPARVFGIARAPLVRRQLVAGCGVVLGVTLSAISTLLYALQHPWFVRYGQAGLALALGLAASAMTGAALLGWLRARSNRTALSTWCPSLGAFVLAAGASALLATVEPSVVEARVALARGDLEHAALTVDALASPDCSPEERAILLDDIRLARMRSADSLLAKVAIASSAPWTEARRAPMQAVLRRAAQGPIAEARGGRDGDDVRALLRLARALGNLLPTEARGLAVEATTRTADRCLARSDLACLERAAQELRHLRAEPERTRIHGALVALVRRDFERALAALTRAPSAQVLLVHTTAAVAHCTHLMALDAPLPRSTCLVLQRALERMQRSSSQATKKRAAPQTAASARKLAGAAS